MILLTALASPALATDEDPFLWLEEVEGKKPLAWVEKQDHRTEKELGRADGYDGLRERLLSIMDADDRIAWPTQSGTGWTNFWQDAEHHQGIWRRTSRESYLSGKPEWELLIDLDALSSAEGKSWVWHGATCLPPEERRCLVSLSDGGSDAEIVREFDTVDKRWVEGGFALPEAKNQVGWIDLDTVFVGTDLGEGSMTDSGYPRQARRWKRGTPVADSEIAYEGQQSDVSVGGYRDFTPGFEREWVSRGVSFFESEQWLVVDGKLVKLEVPLDANASSWREWLLVQPRSDWEVGGTTWPAGSLVAAKLDDFLAGGRTFQALFTPTERTALSTFGTTEHHLVVQTLDNVRSRAFVLTPQPDGTFARSDLAGLPENSDYSIWALDSHDSDEIVVRSEDFLTPTTAMLGSAVPGAPAPVVFATMPARFEAAGLEISQHQVNSKDGTRVPYFQVSRAGLSLDGTNPTVIDGYGGFEIAMTPDYSGGVGAGWLEKGGVYVVANIRGGGEFGPTWHTAALKQNRPRAYEDFAAVAEDLIARKVTSPDHLGAMGGSNGGLLMGNMAMGWPDLFGAILCQVPLLDMKRYSHLLAGASWMGEYGDPDDPAQWSYIQGFSPYHLVKADADYPRILFQTSTMDDRVHPAHARKMAAKMMSMKHDVLYWENTQGGHGGAANNEQRARMWALAWTFLWEELGDTEQDPS